MPPSLMDTTQTLTTLDHRHVWHPFTPMKQWRDQPPLVIDRAEGEFLIDTQGRRYIDGVSSLWCNVHGHRVEKIDQAVRDQLDKVAHTTLLGLASGPSIELAAMLADRAPGGLNKVFYSDAGATAVEVAFKMAVGYWYHSGQPQKNRFIGFQGAYHGDTTGSMSVGFIDLFHRPFTSMVFPTHFAPAPDATAPPPDVEIPDQASGGTADTTWPSKNPRITEPLKRYCLAQLEALLQEHRHEIAAIVIEPIMQGAAGMICQPPGFLRGVADLAKRYDALLIADEVATGFGRTGEMFACEHEQVEPDIMCLAKGITGGYLPLAVTLATDRIEQAFCGELADRRTLYHGHTYTGNALGCAAAIASLQLFDETSLLEHINASAAIITDRLNNALRGCPGVVDIRQRGIMVGIDLGQSQASDHNHTPDAKADRLSDPNTPGTAALCLAMRDKGLIIRPLGDVIVLMPVPAMGHDTLHRMLDIVVEALLEK